MPKSGEEKDRILQEIQAEIQQMSPEWRVSSYLSCGAYGEVCDAVHTQTGAHVAIKRVYKAKRSRDEEVVILHDDFLSRRVFREIALLSHFHHENILGLVTVLRLPHPPEEIEKVYMIMECMDADLSHIIRNERLDISDAHIQYFQYQILHGLKCLHDAGVMHRDLHPGNVLLNGQNEVKICDFNLAKGSDQSHQHTAYVTYRWYRAPELVMQCRVYDCKIDLWSGGCIMAEMYNRRPLFPGTTFYNQLNKIIEIIGTPGREEIDRMGSRSAKDYLTRELCGIPARPWERVIRSTNPLALDLIANLLVFSPGRRFDVNQALHHEYFKSPTCLFDEKEFQGVTRNEPFHHDERIQASADVRRHLAGLISSIQEQHRAQMGEEGVGDAPAAVGADGAEDEAQSPRMAGLASGGGMIRTNSDYNIEMIDRVMQELEGVDGEAGDDPPDSDDDGRGQEDRQAGC
eukprot:TRINITY_DN6107_c0_g1_i1.p1 TRINITY_DN6107_c0_g1~~TRINITY_DN6107_c0_g1_i1.p1  ORF type:complete len:460 (+),score=99.86 TRINITY_DN6107_c0_g1_i1:91-1470(+)